MNAHSLRQVIDPALRISGFVSATTVAALAILVVTDIVIRNLELASWPWLNELTEYLLTISTFFGAPWILSRNGHVNVDVLLRMVRRSTVTVLTHVSNAIGLAVSAVVAWLALTALLDAQSTGALIFKNIIFPEWYMMVPILSCFTLCGLEFLTRLLPRGTDA
ncbi:TRAP transporter small permease [Thalassovita aquimarina]|uniref:TRAP transporter small permease n=1 Tax=Thalassovita aquimarina TaxID=2785917 RepID=UPI0035656263